MNIDNLTEEQIKALEVQKAVPHLKEKEKMIPGLTLMYEDLKGKSVNWHQVLIYKENVLTPYQKYKQRMLEKIKSEENVMKL